MRSFSIWVYFGWGSSSLQQRRVIWFLQKEALDTEKDNSPRTNCSFRSLKDGDVVSRILYGVNFAIWSVMEETQFFPESPRLLLGMKNHYIDSERRYNLHPQVPVTHQDPNTTGTLRTRLSQYFLAQTEFLLLSKYLYYKLEVGKHKRKKPQQHQSMSSPITMKNYVDNQNGTNKNYENQWGSSA